MTTLAHIVGGGPVWPLWLTGTLLFGGAVAAMAVPQNLRRACLVVAGVGLLSTAVVYTVLPVSPTPPQGLTVRIAAPAAGATVTSPVLVKVCGATSSLPGGGRLLSVSVDGRQVAEVDADTAVVTLTAGTTHEQLVFHIHAHLAVYVSGTARTVPEGIGIMPPRTEEQSSEGPYVYAGSCFYTLHAHTDDGIIHIESPVQRTYTLGNFFDVWGIPLDATHVGPASGTVIAYVNGKRYSGDLRSIPLNVHDLIQLDVNGDVAPQPFAFPAGTYGAFPSSAPVALTYTVQGTPPTSSRILDRV